jgi:ketosteroid isomerase-like protein
MKRIVYASVMVLVALSLAALSLVALRQPAGAQDPAKQDMATDVKQAISKFVAAVNSGDMVLASTFISTQSQVSAIANGQILLGPQAISTRLNNIMGLQGKYKFAVSSLNVANVNGLALVTGTYTASLRGKSSAAASKGAVMFLLENKGKKAWIITHIHRSIGEAVVVTE